MAATNSAFTQATSEPFQTGLAPVLKADIHRITGTWQVFKNGTKPVWNGSEVASVNALYVMRKK